MEPYAVVNGCLSINLPVLLRQELPFSGSLEENLVTEVILLSRGPKGLVSQLSSDSSKKLTKG